MASVKHAYLCLARNCLPKSLSRYFFPFLFSFSLSINTNVSAKQHVVLPQCWNLHVSHSWKSAYFTRDIPTPADAAQQRHLPEDNRTTGKKCSAHTRHLSTVGVTTKTPHRKWSLRHYTHTHKRPTWETCSGHTRHLSTRQSTTNTPHNGQWSLRHYTQTHTKLCWRGDSCVTNETNFRYINIK